MGESGSEGCRRARGGIGWSGIGGKVRSVDKLLAHSLEPPHPTPHSPTLTHSLSLAHSLIQPTHLPAVLVYPGHVVLTHSEGHVELHLGSRGVRGGVTSGDHLVE